MPALEKNHIYRSTIEGYSSEGLGAVSYTHLTLPTILRV